MFYLFETLVIVVVLLVLDLTLPFRLRFDDGLLSEEFGRVRLRLARWVFETSLKFATILPIFLVSFQVAIIPCCNLETGQTKKTTRVAKDSRVYLCFLFLF